MDPSSKEFRQSIEQLLEHYKIMVIYGKMSLKEFWVRRDAFDNLLTSLNQKATYCIGWKSLFRRLKEVDPTLKASKDIRRARLLHRDPKY